MYPYYEDENILIKSVLEIDINLYDDFDPTPEEWEELIEDYRIRDQEERDFEIAVEQNNEEAHLLRLLHFAENLGPEGGRRAEQARNNFLSEMMICGRLKAEDFIELF